MSEKTEKGEVVKKVGDPEVLKMWDSGEVLTERKILYEGGKEESIKTITIWNSVPVLVKEEYEKSGKITDGEHISHLISVTGRTTLVTQSEDKVLCLALSGITKPVEDQLDQISEEWNIKEEYIGKMVSVKGYGFKQTETIDRTGKVTSNDGPVKIRIKDHHVTCDELYHLLIDQIDFQ